MKFLSFFFIASSLSSLSFVDSFLPATKNGVNHPSSVPTITDKPIVDDAKDLDISNYLKGVVAPLQYIGPYPCLSLKFPKLKNSTFTFLLDTGANTNSVDSKLAQQLGLPLVECMDKFSLVGSTGTGPDQKAGNLHYLGECELTGLPPPTFTFMKNLTAASLPYASPVGVGLLSLALFHSFPAGVELDWYGTDGDPPTIIFYYGKHLPSDAAAGMTRIPLQTLPGGVMSLIITVNGVEIPALLDTGSPITVLNEAAASITGIKATRDYALKIGGVDGGQRELKISSSTVPLSIGSVSMGGGRVFVGDLPSTSLIHPSSLANDDNQKAAAVLGADFLRHAYRIILRAPAQEMWIEELKDQPRFIPNS